MSDIFDHELDAFESIMDTLEDSPADLIGCDDNYFVKKITESYDDVETLPWLHSVFD